MKICSIMFFTRFLPLFYALVGFGLLITIHECGHFLFCKLFKIHTPTFSIGMGPTLLKRKVGKTNFRLALIPIGGYVEIAGMSEVGQGEQKHALDVGSTSFASKPYWQRFLVLMGGILFNILFAYAAFSALYMVGMPVAKEVSLVVSSVSKEEKHKGIDFKVGDRIVKIDNNDIKVGPKALRPLFEKISSQIVDKKLERIKVIVERSGKMVPIDVPVKANGGRLPRGWLGGAGLEPIPVKVAYEKYSFFPAIAKGVLNTHSWIGKVLSSLKMLVTQRNIKDFGGPIMIVSQSFKMAQRGLSWLFIFLAIISINLAVINLLPIGALDGGQLLFETVEAIIRRKIPDVIRLGINLASWILILSLIMFLSYQDIKRAIFGR